MGMAQNELDAIKKRESLKMKKDERVRGKESGTANNEKPEQKKSKKKTQAET